MPILIQVEIEIAVKSSFSRVLRCSVVPIPILPPHRIAGIERCPKIERNVRNHKLGFGDVIALEILE